MTDEKPPSNEKVDDAAKDLETPEIPDSAETVRAPSNPSPAQKPQSKPTQILSPASRPIDPAEMDKERAPEPIMAPPPFLQDLAPKVLGELPEILRNRSAHSSRPGPFSGNPNNPGSISGQLLEAVVIRPSDPGPPASKPPIVEDGIVVTLHGQTDVGLVREHNEDNFVIVDVTSGARGVEDATAHHRVGSRGSIFAVCDGMGGAAAGEVASQMAVDTLFEMMRAGEVPKERDDFARRLVRSIEEAGTRIFAAAKMDRTRRGMGTTSTVAGLVDKTLFVGQVGDSRAYVLRGESFAQITKDQSLINQLIEAGQLTEAEAENFEYSNIILQALGTAESVQVDLTFLELRRGDRLMLCSDGLSGLVHPQVIREVLSNVRDPRGACATLIELARNGGGHDNITVIVVDFDGQDLPPRDEQPVAYQQYPLVPVAAVPSLPPRRESIFKSGTQKPGGDVKDTAPQTQPPGLQQGMLSPAAMIALGIVVVVGVVVGVMMMASRPTKPANNPARSAPTVDVAPAVVESPSTAPVEVKVTTDIENAALYVDDEAQVALDNHGPKSVFLSPGVYRFEARVGESSVAHASVTVSAGTPANVELRMPAGAGETGAPVPTPAPAENGATAPAPAPAAAPAAAAHHPAPTPHGDLPANPF